MQVSEVRQIHVLEKGNSPHPNRLQGVSPKLLKELPATSQAKCDKNDIQEHVL